MGWGELRRPAAFGMAAMLAATLAVTATGSVSGASATACKVTVVEIGRTEPSLARAIDRSLAGDHLRVKGICPTNVTISHALTITGVRTRRSGAPVVDGRGQGTAITTEGGAKVLLASLTVRGGTPGEGIHNGGKLTLRNVRVRGNVVGILNDATLALDGTSVVTANSSGGVFNNGTLTMNGSSSITANTGGNGAGVNNYGTVVMNGSSSIKRNTAGQAGGGVWNHDVASLTMNDTTVIAANSAEEGGGGVANEGLLKMADSSRITGNVGNGVDNFGYLDGVFWPPDDAHPNVYDNTPADVVLH
jgi:hypothetical protein